MGVACRGMTRTYDHFHPYVWGDEVGRMIRGGAPAMAVMYGPAGLVGPVGATDHPYTGMDPSDPVTWVRPYSPQPGMISYLNFDGAAPNDGQVITGRPRNWRGGGRKRNR
jgi:hypothetical protein